jgi:hypothetical protein
VLYDGLDRRDAPDCSRALQDALTTLLGMIAADRL